MKYLFFLFLFVISSNVQAIDGCVSSVSGIMYTNQIGGSPNYRGNTGEPFITLPVGAGCYWIYVIPNTPCLIKKSTGDETGLLANTIYECDLDTNALILLFGSVGFGAFMLRQKRDTNFIFGSK